MANRNSEPSDFAKWLIERTKKCEQQKRKNIIDGILKPYPEAVPGYGVTAWVEQGVCQGCGAAGPILVADSTGVKEYTPVKLCEFCIGHMFDHPQK